MVPDVIAHAGVLINILLAAACFGVLLFGVWMARDPHAFWNTFNPFLKPYSQFTLRLGLVIGLLWIVGAVCGWLIVCGNAVRAGLHHHWI